MVPRSVPLILLSLILLLPSSCGKPADRQERTETLQSGVVRITYSNLSDRRLSLDTLAVWDLWDESSGYTFNRIHNAAGFEGGFVLLDSGNRHLVKLNMLGKVEVVMGGDGSGPGEFRYPRYLDICNDEIMAGDIMLQRYSVFGLDGEYKRDVRWQISTMPGESGIKVVDANSVLYSVDSPMGPRFLLIDSLSDGGVADTLVSMDSLPIQLLEITAPDGRKITFDTPPQFAPEIYWALTQGSRIVTVTTTDYQFEERDLTGHIHREVLAPTPDLSVTENIKEWFFENTVFGFSDDPGSYQANQEIRNKWQFADRRQAITAIKVDPFNRIWVQASTGDPEITRMDIYDFQHKYLGNLGDIPMPMAFTTDGYALVRVRQAGEDETDLYFVASLDSRLR